MPFVGRICQRCTICSDTLTQSGVGVNSSCGGASIGDTCVVFFAEGYPLTCACDRCDNPLCLSFGIDFSDCFSLTYNETCVVRFSVEDTGTGHRNVTEFMLGRPPGFLGVCGERSCPPSECRPSAFCLGTITSSRQTVTSQELKCKLQLPVLCGRRVELSNHPGQVAGVSGQLRGFE